MVGRQNDLDPNLDIKGIENHNQSLTLSDEPLYLGKQVIGQIGGSASITLFSSNILTITGLSGFSTNSVGRFLYITNSSSNNGVFLIESFLSSSSVNVLNYSGSAPDVNNGSISWSEREPYTLEDNINFSHTDRKLIKGTSNWYDAVPTYQRPTNIGVDLFANLSNIAGKTTDAQGFIFPRTYRAAAVSISDTFITIADSGNLQHSDSIDKTGVPLFDTAPYVGDFNSCYVLITNPINDNQLEVLSGLQDGYIIFGITRKGSSVESNSVEIVWYCVKHGNDLDSAVPYTWENDQPNIIDLTYGYFLRLDQADENAFRKSLISGSFNGNAGGDLSGTYPNPSVVDLTITGEQQGSILYFNGTNWVQLMPGNTGYVLTTHSTNTNPSWESPSAVSLPTATGPSQLLVSNDSNMFEPRYPLVGDVDGNILVTDEGHIMIIG